MLRYGSLLFVILFWSLLASASPVEFALSIPAGDGVKQASAIGMGGIVIQADWPRIQPSKGQWKFDWLDAQIAAAQKKDLSVTLVFGSTPQWAVPAIKNPTKEEASRAAPDIAALKLYVDAVVKRYRGRVGSYQIWCRPCGATLLTTPDVVMSLFRAVAKAVHFDDAKARVIAAEPGDVDLAWIAGYLQGAKGLERPDIISLSPRRLKNDPQAFWWRVSVLRQRVLPGGGGPSLSVEIPLKPGDGVGAINCAGMALLADIPRLTISIESTDSGDIRDAGWRDMLRLQGRKYRGWRKIVDGVMAGEFELGAKHLVMSFPFNKTDSCKIRLTPLGGAGGNDGLTADGKEVLMIPIGGESRRIAIDGEVSAEASARMTLWENASLATFFTGTPDAPPAAFPGDSVSLGNGIVALPDMPSGRFRIETQDGAEVLCTVKDKFPWIHFDVADGFIFFNTARAPLEVSVDLFGVTTPNKTGFNLYYDGIDGMTYTPWQWIDTGRDKVYTYRFVLKDALFSNREGYDIRLNMGGSQESVRVKAIRVRKLAN